MGFDLIHYVLSHTETLWPWILSIGEPTAKLIFTHKHTHTHTAELWCVYLWVCSSCQFSLCLCDILLDTHTIAHKHTLAVIFLSRQKLLLVCVSSDFSPVDLFLLLCGRALFPDVIRLSSDFCARLKFKRSFPFHSVIHALLQSETTDILHSSVTCELSWPCQLLQLIVKESGIVYRCSKSTPLL